MKYIEIFGAEDEFLSIGLNDLLKCFHEDNELFWCILFVEAIGELSIMNMLEFEKLVSQSENGFPIKQSDLIRFSLEVEQIFNIVLIGNRKPEMNKCYPTYDDMYKSCDFTIELIDSSYWVVHAKDTQDLNLFKDIKGIEVLED